MAPQPFDEKRDRGFLTKADREFLMGEKYLSEQGVRDTRYRIRNRVVNGILDFSFLKMVLKDDLQLIAEKLDAGHFGPVHDFTFNTLVEKKGSLDEAKDEIEDLMERSLKDQYQFRNVDYITEDVSVEITVDRIRPDIEDLVQKFYQGKESRTELEYLRQKDALKLDENLVSGRHLQHLYEMGGMSDELKETIISHTGLNDIDEYFEKINEKIAQEGENKGKMDVE